MVWWWRFWTRMRVVEALDEGVVQSVWWWRFWMRIGCGDGGLG